MQTTTSESTAIPTIPDSQDQPRSEAINRIAGSAHQAVDRVAQGADHTLQALRGSTEAWKETGDQSLERVQAYVREQPLTALGIAAAVGFLLSRLLR